jgi:hypothetical protein
MGDKIVAAGGKDTAVLRRRLFFVLLMAARLQTPQAWHSAPALAGPVLEVYQLSGCELLIP